MVHLQSSAAVPHLKAMKTLASLVLCACLVNLASAQDGPTLRECRRNANIWQIGLFNAEGEANLESSPHLLAQDLIDRSDAMFDCYGHYKKPEFLQIARGYYTIYQWRVYKFVSRHDLLDRFNEEDEAGQR